MRARAANGGQVCPQRIAAIRTDHSHFKVVTFLDSRWATLFDPLNFMLERSGRLFDHGD